MSEIALRKFYHKT